MLSRFSDELIDSAILSGERTSLAGEGIASVNMKILFSFRV
jgi:hypothetical protein